MSANGMCQHNNQMGYCPSCSWEKTGMRSNRLKVMSGGGMGADCPQGYYEAKIFGISTGQCVPNLSTLADAATQGAAGAVGSGVAQSPATQQAATAAAGSALGSKIISFYKDKPLVAYGLTGVVALLVIYGGMSFIRGR